MQEYIVSLHHIGMPTANMNGTIKFYSDFGAEIIYEKDDCFENKPIRVVLMKFMDMVLEFYERDDTASIVGAIDHLAFSVKNIDKMYRIAKKSGYNFMQECVDSVQVSTYWPKPARWFIVYGVNYEKIEFYQAMA